MHSCYCCYYIVVVIVVAIVVGWSRLVNTPQLFQLHCSRRLVRPTRHRNPLWKVALAASAGFLRLLPPALERVAAWKANGPRMGICDAARTLTRKIHRTEEVAPDKLAPAGARWWLHKSMSRRLIWSKGASRTQESNLITVTAFVVTIYRDHPMSTAIVDNSEPRLLRISIRIYKYKYIYIYLFFDYKYY